LLLTLSRGPLRYLLLLLLLQLAQLGPSSTSHSLPPSNAPNHQPHLLLTLLNRMRLLIPDTLDPSLTHSSVLLLLLLLPLKL
jgi:hypothetical protein